MSVTHQRSDEEMDREFRSSARRPQSTMARHFSVTLDDLFKIDNSIVDLDVAVDQKKRMVSTRNSELKALEDAIRATEERLKANGATPSPSSLKPTGGDDDAASADRLKTASSRPGSARKAAPSPTQNGAVPPRPGARPPTPGTSGSEAEEEEDK